MCSEQVYFCDSHKSKYCRGKWRSGYRACKNWRNGCRVTRTGHYGTTICSPCRRFKDRIIQERRAADLKGCLKDLSAVRSNSRTVTQNNKEPAKKWWTTTLALRNGSERSTKSWRDRPAETHRGRSRSPHRRTRDEREAAAASADGEVQRPGPRGAPRAEDASKAIDGAIRGALWRQRGRDDGLQVSKLFMLAYVRRILFLRAILAFRFRIVSLP